MKQHYFKTKKTQMEILGLAVIILLVSMAILFVVKFVLMSPQNNIKKDYTFNQLASNELSAILRSSTTCKGTDVTELLQDCATYNNIHCENNQDSCEFSRDTIAFLLSNTLDVWKKSYLLDVSLNGNNLMTFKNGKFDDNTERQTKIFPIPVETGSLIVTINIYG